MIDNIINYIEERKKDLDQWQGYDDRAYSSAIITLNSVINMLQDLKT